MPTALRVVRGGSQAPVDAFVPEPFELEVELEDDDAPPVDVVADVELDPASPAEDPESEDDAREDEDPSSEEESEDFSEEGPVEAVCESVE